MSKYCSKYHTWIEDWLTLVRVTSPEVAPSTANIFTYTCRWMGGGEHSRPLCSIRDCTEGINEQRTWITFKSLNENNNQCKIKNDGLILKKLTQPYNSSPKPSRLLMAVGVLSHGAISTYFSNSQITKRVIPIA
jgi:hypothetical protein